MWSAAQGVGPGVGESGPGVEGRGRGRGLESEGERERERPLVEREGVGELEESFSARSVARLGVLGGGVEEARERLEDARDDGAAREPPVVEARLDALARAVVRPIGVRLPGGGLSRARLRVVVVVVVVVVGRFRERVREVCRGRDARRACPLDAR